MAPTILKGNFPVLATAWTDEGEFDESSQARLIDWVIDSGAHGLVLNAVASEAHAMSDSEQAKVIEFNFQRVANRVPVVVTVTHYSVEVAAEKARRAEDLGAACVMSMPPFFGRWSADLAGALGYFRTICSAASGPVMVQDHEISGLGMGPDFLATLAREFQNLRYFKIEVTQSPWKIEKVLQAAGEHLDGIFGGAGGAFSVDEYERGSRGSMPACYMPAVFTKVYDLLEAGESSRAAEFFFPYLPLLQFDQRMADRCLWKAILKHLGVISSERIRGPIPAHWDDRTRQQLIRHVERCGPESFGVALKPRKPYRQPPST